MEPVVQFPPPERSIIATEQVSKSMSSSPWIDWVILFITYAALYLLYDWFSPLATNWWEQKRYWTQILLYH